MMTTVSIIINNVSGKKKDASIPHPNESNATPSTLHTSDGPLIYGLPI